MFKDTKAGQTNYCEACEEKSKKSKMAQSAFHKRILEGVKSLIEEKFKELHHSNDCDIADGRFEVCWEYCQCRKVSDCLLYLREALNKGISEIQ